MLLDYELPPLISKEKYIESKKGKRYNQRRIGTTFKTEHGDYLVVAGGSDKNCVTILLEDDKTEYEAEIDLLKSGKFKSPMAITVLNVGYIGLGDAIIKWKGNRIHPAYTKWYNMLTRAYVDTEGTTYEDVYVVDEWLNYNTFYKWFMENKPSKYQLMNGSDRYELDKDLMAKGGEGKYYGPDRCIFIDKYLNSFLAFKKLNTSTGHTGVKKNGSGFQASIIHKGELIHLGTYRTAEEASEKYKEKRAELVEIMKEKYRKEGSLPEEAIENIC